jgi:hypothetical protein
MSEKSFLCNRKEKYLRKKCSGFRVFQFGRVLACPKYQNSRFQDLLLQFPGKLEVTGKNVCDIWIQHLSIIQKRIAL